jgi:hypothetical protein
MSYASERQPQPQPGSFDVNDATQNVKKPMRIENQNKVERIKEVNVIAKVLTYLSG